MEKIVSGYLLNLEFGEMQEFQNMGLIPLLTSTNRSPAYLTLKEALEKRLLVVKEVDYGGSVPELKVVNKAETPVLLLDGEELVGAKQNRVLNTTILLKKKSETVIPVSCTEQGRWSYVSDEFANSNVVLSHRMRTTKAASVAQSLKCTSRYEADQSAIWSEIDMRLGRTGVRSPTGAMKDMYTQRKNELDDYLKAFKCVDGQKGLLVSINGKVVGFDIISLESAYKTLHPKLVKSYAIDAFLERKKKDVKTSVDKATDFLNEITKCKEKKYKSIGHGWDYRFEGKNIVGSALVYRKKVIHTAFFRITEVDKTGRMAGSRRRRKYRI